MGHEIESVARERGHQTGHVFNSANPVSADLLSEADVAIEFSRPELAVSNILICAEAGCPVVVGTTGWYHDFEKVSKQVEHLNGSLLYGTNFSVGVNIVFFINQMLARLMNAYPEYQAEIEEIHHTRKLDAPSGTAITLAEGLIQNHSSYIEWQLANPGSSGVLNIEAIREDDVPGTHTVTYRSEIDTIELKHTAHNRKGFALGAVKAAEWLKDKKGIYSMRDMLNFDALIQT